MRKTRDFVLIGTDNEVGSESHRIQLSCPVAGQIPLRQLFLPPE